MEKKERHYVMGVIGAGLGALITMVLSIKYPGSLGLSIAEALAAVAVAVGVARKNLVCAYLATGYFCVSKGIPITIIVVAAVGYLLVQGVMGISAYQDSRRPPPLFSAEEKALMEQSGVQHNGRYFVARGMHFDQLAQALEHVAASRHAP